VHRQTTMNNGAVIHGCLAMHQELRWQLYVL